MASKIESDPKAVKQLSKLGKPDGVDRSLALKDLYATNQMQNVQNSIDAFNEIPELSKLNAVYLNTITQATEDINWHKHIFEAVGNLEPMNKAWLYSSAISQLKSETDYLSPIKEAKKVLSQGVLSYSIAEMAKNSALYNMKHEMTATEIAAKEWEKLASADYLKQFGAADYTVNQLQSVQNSINAFKQTAESAGGYDKILELAKNGVAPFSYAEEAIKKLNQHKHIFEAASNLESINKALMSSSAMAQLKSTTDYLSSIKEVEKVLSQGVLSYSIAEMAKNSASYAGIEQSFKPENFNSWNDTYKPRVEIPENPNVLEIQKIPKNPMPKQLSSLIELTDKLIESQNCMLEILVKQLDATERQLNLQKSNFEDQLKLSVEQQKDNAERQQRQF